MEDHRIMGNIEDHRIIVNNIEDQFIDILMGNNVRDLTRLGPRPGAFIFFFYGHPWPHMSA